MAEGFSERRARVVPRGVSAGTGVRAARAKNGELWDTAGKRYIDFAGGIGVQNSGHAHPAVVKAIQQQAENFIHTCYTVVGYEGYVELAERLAEVTPGNFPKKVAFFNSGAEGIENACKVARAATGRRVIIAFDRAFHGRTLFTLALTGKTKPYKHNFGAVYGDVVHAPFPWLYRRPEGMTEDGFVDFCLQALRDIFETKVGPDNVAGILIELVQGEGGFLPAPPRFAHGVRDIAKELDIPLIVDEVQSGYGRTGKMFACEHYGIEPDILVAAKSLAGGMPLSAVVGRAELMDAPDPGALGGTYSGNPLALAAGLAVLDVYAEEDIVNRGARLGELARNRLEQMKARFPEIGEVRGLGPMLAIELVEDQKTKQPATDLVNRVTALCTEKGLIVLSCGLYGNVIRFLFPLTISDELLEEGLAIVEASLAECAAPVAAGV
jgi:4-aminobutyrate aminotransferase